MSARVEHIRREIDQLAPTEAQELFADLQQAYAFRLVSLDESAPQVDNLSHADQMKLEALRRDVQEAADQLDRGEGIEIEWAAKRASRHQAFAARQTA
ncbi:MAG: hypothetical protein V4662_08925 [Verrucomicrobiota bacterium]